MADSAGKDGQMRWPTRAFSLQGRLLSLLLARGYYASLTRPPPAPPLAPVLGPARAAAGAKRC